MTSSQIPSWIERRFDFNFPASLFLNLIARVRGAPPRLEDAVRGLSREQLIEKRNGKWSIQENAGHLLDEEELFARRLQAYLEGAEILPPAPYANRKLAHNDREIQTILIEFRAARERQTQELVRLQPEDFGRSAWHSRLKVKMRLVDHLYFVAEHDDHHLARIWELRCA